jgi:hypothetical protein
MPGASTSRSYGSTVPFASRTVFFSRSTAAAICRTCLMP